MREITTVEDFNSVIEDTEADFVLAVFSAPWCGPCKAMAPVLEQLDERHNHIEFVKVNVDEAGELATGIRSVPTYRLYRKGETSPQAVEVGLRNRSVFENWLLQNTAVEVIPEEGSTQTIGLQGLGFQLYPKLMGE